MAKHTLTERAVRTAAVPPGKTETTIYDGGGLTLRVRATTPGKPPLRAWQFWYVRGQRRQRVGLGGYPEVGLAAAREKAEHYRALLKAGITVTTATPAAAPGAPLIPRTVAELVDRWIGGYVAIKRKDGGAAVRASLAKHALPAIGGVRLADLRKLHMVHVVEPIAKAGNGRTAAVVLATLRQMFLWAVRQEYVAIDPTAGLQKSDYAGKTTMRERVLAPAELQDLAQRMRATKRGGPIGRERDIPVVPLWTQAAVWTMLGTLARVGELSQARWEHVDFDAGTWYIPPENSKNAKAHVVSLSPFAARHLRHLQVFAAGSAWVMPGRDPAQHIDTKAVTKQLRDRQHADARPRPGRSAERTALLLAGGGWTSHDLRRTGATLMQAAGVPPAVVERCLNHVEADKMMATYQRDEMLPQRKAAFAKLGKRLDALVPAAATAHLALHRGA